MAHLAIYRKYRPDSFDKLIGQDHIVQSLTNQIKSGQIGHAYLFTGTRGTGKTSTARMVARAVNCLKNINGSPCGKCAVCKELVKTNLDIIEIDAASNNGVDEIRDLRDRVNFMPSVGKYKVYIIDEVHMLSIAAFNALLKTLEEPPAHVVFILGTTEVHKVPATILSRCMRFDFKLVSVPKLKELMAGILKDCGKAYSDEALTAVAVAGEGSVRDALTVLDRCVSYADGKLEYADVLQVLGATDRGKIFELADSILNNDTAAILAAINDIALSGKSISVLAKDMAAHMRDLLVCKTCADSQSILSLPQDVFEKLKEQSKQATAKKLLFALEKFNRAENELKTAAAPRISFEVVCFKVAGSSGETDGEMLELRVRELEKRGVAVTAASKPEAAAKNFDSGKKIWAKVLSGVRSLNSELLLRACENINSVFVLGSEFVAEADAAQYSLLTQKENYALLSKLVKELGGALLTIKSTEKQKGADESDLESLKKLLGENLKIEK